MNDKHDAEKILERLRIGPGAGVKRSVMERFNERFGAVRDTRPPIFFWRRPVPLYLAVAAVIAALLVAAPVQNRLFPRDDRRYAHQESGKTVNSASTVEAADIRWNIAHSDFI